MALVFITAFRVSFLNGDMYKVFDIHVTHQTHYVIEYLKDRKIGNKERAGKGK